MWGLQAYLLLISRLQPETSLLPRQGHEVYISIFCRKGTLSVYVEYGFSIEQIFSGLLIVSQCIRSLLVGSFPLEFEISVPEISAKNPGYEI